MMAMLIGLLLVVTFGLLAVGIRRANEIAAFRIREGRMEMLRGALPTSVQDAFADAIRIGGVQRGSFRIVSRGGSPTIVTRIPAPEDQRLRNVCALHRHRMKLG